MSQGKKIFYPNFDLGRSITKMAQIYSCQKKPKPFSWPNLALPPFVSSFLCRPSSAVEGWTPSRPQPNLVWGLPGPAHGSQI